MLADPNAHVSTVLAGEIPVANYFVNVLGQPALNMGVDLNFLDNRLTTTFEYFWKDNNGMLSQVTYPSLQLVYSDDIDYTYKSTDREAPA